ncbi:TPA: hypothetical protein ACGIK9_003313 [Acinetobacter baumannii]|uniref:hypothetical protein n=1 Tax=Acinetobacter baumannii TaxID=470 RepID=UPI00338F92AB
MNTIMLGAIEVDAIYDRLTHTQQKMFTEYGLYQIKKMIEVDPVLSVQPPEGSVLIGLNPFMRWNAIDYSKQIRYGFYPDISGGGSWSAANEFKADMQFDAMEDFKAIYSAFNLSFYELDDLSKVHEDYLQRQKSAEHKSKSKPDVLHMNYPLMNGVKNQC